MSLCATGNLEIVNSNPDLAEVLFHLQNDSNPPALEQDEKIIECV